MNNPEHPVSDELDQLIERDFERYYEPAKILAVFVCKRRNDQTHVLALDVEYGDGATDRFLVAAMCDNPNLGRKGE